MLSMVSVARQVSSAHGLSALILVLMGSDVSWPVITAWACLSLTLARRLFSLWCWWLAVTARAIAVMPVASAMIKQVLCVKATVCGNRRRNMGIANKMRAVSAIPEMTAMETIIAVLVIAHDTVSQLITAAGTKRRSCLAGCFTIL